MKLYFLKVCAVLFVTIFDFYFFSADVLASDLRVLLCVPERFYSGKERKYRDGGAKNFLEDSNGYIVHYEIGLQKVTKLYHSSGNVEFCSQQLARVTIIDDDIITFKCQVEFTEENVELIINRYSLMFSLDILSTNSNGANVAYEGKCQLIAPRF